MVNHLINQTVATSDLKAASYYLKGAELTGNAVLWDLHPTVAAGLGIEAGASLTREQIGGLLAGRRVDGEKIDGKQYAKVRDMGIDAKTGEHKVSSPIGSYDFCPQPGKSVSCCWAFAPPTEQATIMRAHLDASRYAVREVIIPEIAVCRAGKGGQDGEVSGHVAVVEFTHTTERQTVGPDGKVTPGDMGIHTHTLIPNAVFDGENGRVGSLHTARVRGTISEANAAYNARLAQNLRDAGYDAALDPVTRTCVIRTVPQEVCEHFSKRSRGIEAAAKATAAERGEDWNELTQDQREARLDLMGQKIKWSNKGGKDDVAAFADWRRQAEDIGWKPPLSFVSELQRPELSDEQRHRLAYETALPFLEAAYEQKTTLSQWDVRSAATWGLIHSGYHGVSDTNAVTQLFREHGIRQDGERTPLIWGQEEGKHYISITTGLHESQEREFLSLAKAAAEDRSAAIPADLLERKIATSGLDFSDKHGKAQLAMVRRLSEARFAVGIGAAGSGKTALLSSMVSAWKDLGRDVWGVAVAHQQADALTDAGISENRVAALSGPNLPKTRTFIEAAKAGRIALNDRSVVIVDELATLGTRQALELLRLRERHGFTLVCIGDDRQCSSIEAGAIVDLTRKALGSDQVPEILSTRRQVSEREKLVVGLLRKGEAKQAIDLKREDGTAIMVPGGYRETIAAVAAKYVERLRETGQAPAISAATNRDAHEISIAVRAERRALGQLGPDVRHVRAVGQKGHEYNLALAVGDKVRLFATAKARFADGSGGRIGRNGHVLQVLALNAEGMTARALKTGKQGFIRWDDLTTKTGRVHLAYGDCVTINAGQGATRKEGNILALPTGSRAIDGHSAYSALTRHTDWCCLMTSEAAETAEVRQSRTLDDPRPITEDDRWGNVGRHIAYQPAKDLALSLLERASQIFRGSVRDFAPSLQPAEARVARQEPPSHAQDHFAERQAEEATRPVANEIVASMEALALHLEAREARRMRVAAGMVAEGALPFSEAQDRLISAILAEQTKGAARDAIHDLPKRIPGAETAEQVEARVVQEFGEAVERACLIEESPRERAHERQAQQQGHGMTL